MTLARWGARTYRVSMRSTALAALLVAVGVALTACTVDEPPSTAPSASVSASSAAAPSAPAPAASASVDAEAWASGAIPVNTTDDAEVWRESGVVDGTPADHTVDGLDGGSWVVSFACLAADGTRAALTVASDADAAETIDVACTADPSAPAELFQYVRNVGSSAKLSVQSDVSTAFVLAISRDRTG